MRPVSPVLPGYNAVEVSFSDGGGSEVLVGVVTEDNQSVLTRWELTAEERERIAKGQDLFLWIRLVGNSISPFSPEISTPAELMEGVAPTGPAEPAVTFSKSDNPDDWPTLDEAAKLF